jgi:hypothetical protein
VSFGQLLRHAVNIHSPHAFHPRWRKRCCLSLQGTASADLPVPSWSALDLACCWRDFQLVGGSAARLGVGTRGARAGCWSLTIGFGTLARAHAEPCRCCTRRCQQPAWLRLTGCSTCPPSAPHAGWRTTRAAAAGRRRGSAPSESSGPLRTQIPPHVGVLGGAVARLATWQQQAGPQVCTVSSSNFTRLPFTHFYFTISPALQLELALTLRAEYAS